MGRVQAVQAAQAAYVEDYNSQISEVIPLTRRQAHVKAKPTLETHFEVSDSGYESTLPSEPPSTCSPEESATPTPENDTPSPPLEDPEPEIQLPPRRSHQYAYTSQSYSSPLSRKLSTHLSSQLSSQGSSSNPTPSASKPSSTKSTSRSGSPAVHRGQSSVPVAPSGTAPTAITEEDNCDCSECKTTLKSSPTNQHSALSSPWNINYPPFSSGGVSASPHSSQHWPTYSNATPGRGYATRDYGYTYPLTPTTTDSGDSEPSTRRRDRLPARPLSYGGPAIASANPITTNGSWSSYSYYGGHLQGTTPLSTPPPSYGQSAYSPPPVTPSSATVPATPSTQTYSAMIGGVGYSSYPYTSQEYYSQTQGGPAVPSTPAGSTTSSDYGSMPPLSAMPGRRANRHSIGGLSSSPYSSHIDHAERYHERYAREYAEQYGSYTDKYSDKHSDKYPDKYADKYPSDKYSDKYAEKYPDKYSEKYQERQADKYTEKYGDRYADRYYERYPDKYSDRHGDKYGDYYQQNPAPARRASQRTSQGSGAYTYAQDIHPRSTSVPPADMNVNPTISSTELKRRTATPQPVSTMRRRDSTSGSGSAGALTRLPHSSSRSADNAVIEDDYYGRAAPSSQYYHPRYHSSYDAHALAHHPSASRQSGAISSYNYRSSDSGYSGGSSENKGDETLPLTVPDGEPFTIRYPTGIPVKLQLNGGAAQMTIQLAAQEKKNNIESSAMYRYIRSHQRQQLALQHDVSSRGSSRQLEYDRRSADGDSDYYESRASDGGGIFGELDGSDRSGYPVRYRRRGSMADAEDYYGKGV